MKARHAAPPRAPEARSARKLGRTTVAVRPGPSCGRGGGSWRYLALPAAPRPAAPTPEAGQVRHPLTGGPAAGPWASLSWVSRSAPRGVFNLKQTEGCARGRVPPLPAVCGLRRGPRAQQMAPGLRRPSCARGVRRGCCGYLPQFIKRRARKGTATWAEGHAASPQRRAWEAACTGPLRRHPARLPGRRVVAGAPRSKGSRCHEPPKGEVPCEKSEQGV